MKEMIPPNFEITKAECCYTCNHRHLGLCGDTPGIQCKFNYSFAEWTSDKRVHPIMSPIGKCDLYEQRDGIEASTEILFADNIPRYAFDEEKL